MLVASRNITIAIISIGRTRLINSTLSGPACRPYDTTYWGTLSLNDHAGITHYRWWPRWCDADEIDRAVGIGRTEWQSRVAPKQEGGDQIGRAHV